MSYETTLNNTRIFPVIRTVCEHFHDFSIISLFTARGSVVQWLKDRDGSRSYGGIGL